VARDATRYRPTARFTSWLFSIAHHRMIDWVRAGRRAISLDALGHEAPALAEALSTDPGDSPLATAVARDQACAVASALAQLPGEQRDAFLLQLEGDLGVEEIARITGVSF